MDNQAHDYQPERLTRREQEVGELLRRGLTNEEIATRLGISLDGAKYHVSQILSKIGVATREEAVQALAAPATRSSRLQWVLITKVAGAALIGVAAVGIGLLGFGVLRSSGPSYDTSIADATGTLQPYAVPSDEPVDTGGQLPNESPGSDKLEFPAYLSNIPGIFRGSASPDDIVFSPDGDLWLAWIGSDGAIVVARNQAGTEIISEYEVPAAQQTTHVRLAFDESGRAVVAFGNGLTLVDPKTLAYKTIDLPPSTATPDTPGGPPPVDTVSTLRVDGETAFVGDFESDAIKQVSLNSGAVSNVAVPSSFTGHIDDFLVTADRIWLLKTGDGPVGQSEIGELDRTNGTLNVINTRVRSAVPSGDWIIAVTWLPDGMTRIDSSGVHPIRSDALDAALIDKLGPEETIHDDGRGGVWLSDVSASAIFWIDPANGGVTTFTLPSWKVGPISCPPSGPRGPTCAPYATELTHITATAVSPDGDLYFADSTLNRVGEIHRP